MADRLVVPLIFLLTVNSVCGMSRRSSMFPAVLKLTISQDLGECHGSCLQGFHSITVVQRTLFPLSPALLSRVSRRKFDR
ncbi:hypothetical protein CC79DRAFT_867098 [Sarocladium strictum]